MATTLAKRNRAEAAELQLKEKFVALWTTGTAATRGNTTEVNRILNTSFNFCDEDIRRLMTEEGVLVPACGAEHKAVEVAPAVPVLSDEVLQSADAPQLASQMHEQELQWRDKLQAVPEDDDKRDWCAKYKELEETINGIALGTVKATAAQARIINMVTERCFGRIKEEAETKEASGVMLLPMIGNGATAMICPRCGYVHQTSDGN